MSEQVKVEDFEILALFRVALLKFGQAATQSLFNADSQIARTHSWLEGEQTSYWQSQLRKRAEAVTRARDAVRQKKLYKDSSGRIPTAVEEEKALAKCLAALEQAQGKIEAIRKALPKLEKAADLYRSGVARLSTVVSGDIPKAVALLDRLAATLEEYVQIEAPAGGVAESAAPTLYEETMSRGGEGGEVPVITVPPAAQAAPPASGGGKSLPDGRGSEEKHDVAE